MEIDASRSDQHVEPTEPSLGLLDGRTNGVLIGYIAAQRQSLRAQFCNLGSDSLRSRFIDICHNDIHTSLRKGLRASSADASAATSDKGNPLNHHAFPPPSW